MTGETLFARDVRMLQQLMSSKNLSKGAVGKALENAYSRSNVIRMATAFGLCKTLEEVKGLKRNYSITLDIHGSDIDRAVCLVVHQVLDHSQCCFSTGICGNSTAGQGELDYNGYWEFPCSLCAAKSREDVCDPT